MSKKLNYDARGTLLAEIDRRELELAVYSEPMHNTVADQQADPSGLHEQLAQSARAWAGLNGTLSAQQPGQTA